MMKQRLSSRSIAEQQTGSILGRSKQEQSNHNQNGPNVQRNQAQILNNQQTTAQAIRKRRSSINVYDQPSSLNSRLRQLETDMLRLDEDRTKLFDDTHSALAQYELKLTEIHAILKSRQDNVEKYVEDMKLLLQAKEKFEKQAKLLTDKQDRIHEKFMHRETTVAREIKLLKNKFELLEKNRQFRSILQKSNALTNDTSEDLASGLDSSEFAKVASEATSSGEADSSGGGQMDKSAGAKSGVGGAKRPKKSVRIKLFNASWIGRFFGPLFAGAGGPKLGSTTGGKKMRNNKVSSMTQGQAGGQPVADGRQRLDSLLAAANSVDITNQSQSDNQATTDLIGANSNQAAAEPSSAV